MDETVQENGYPVIASEAKQSRCWQRNRARREVASSQPATLRSRLTADPRNDRGFAVAQPLSPA
jgi:hypothetical protein